MMQPFQHLSGTAAALPIANIDTDMILSAAFLKTVSRTGLGRGLFHAMRYDGAGNERPDFVLNRDPWRNARILIALDNFGCGSSREHAPWALNDFGIRCVIAPGFADIFYGNCFKNGMLPIRLPLAQVQALIDLASDPATATMHIDLEQCTVGHAGGTLHFDIDAQRRTRLLHGIDDIAQALSFGDRIAGYESSIAQTSPWLAKPGLDQALTISTRR